MEDLRKRLSWFIDLIRTEGAVLAFLMLLFVGFLFGDGKQHITDLILLGGILALTIVLLAYGKKQRSLPKDVSIAWTIMLSVSLGGLLWSYDIGYSLYANMRWVEAFILFSLSYQYFEARSKHLNDLFLLFVMMCALYSFFRSYVLKDSSGPLMNLYYPTYGHNHIVDLILPALPLVVFGLVRTGVIWYTLQFVFYFIIVLLSGSRIAVLTVVIVLPYVVLHKAISNKRVMRVVVWGICLAAIATLFMNNKHAFLPMMGALKKPDFFLSRGEYWQQSLSSFLAHPIIGTGGGTFYLQSVRFQSAPNSYSWFAHGFLLEVLVELGVVGFAATTWLIIVLLKHCLSGIKRNLNPLFYTLLIILVYSQVDYVLSYAVMWAILWVVFARVMVSHSST